MTAQEVIEMLTAIHANDLHQFEFHCAMQLAGDGNKELRQAVIKELTGETLPKSKCGLHHVTEVLRATLEPDTQEEGEWEPEWEEENDNDDYDSGLSHTQQSFQDRADYAREQLEAGNISPEQADEIRHGA